MSLVITKRERSSCSCSGFEMSKSSMTDITLALKEHVMLITGH